MIRSLLGHGRDTTTIHHQEAVTVYAAYGIYHASVSTNCYTLIMLAASQR